VPSQNEEIYNDFIEKFNILFLEYKEYLPEREKQLVENLDTEDILSTVFELIIDYGKCNSVDVVLDFDDIKITYFLGICISNISNTKDNVFMITSLEILKTHLKKNSQYVILDKLLNFLRGEKYFKEYYGLYGIYSTYKAIFYSENRIKYSSDEIEIKSENVERERNTLINQGYVLGI